MPLHILYIIVTVSMGQGQYINSDKTCDLTHHGKMKQLSLHDIRIAQSVINGIADYTPFVPAPSLSSLLGYELLLKLENMQPIGAFKIRGALNAIANIPTDAKGVVACSTGNHGRGLAYGAKARGIDAVICMSSFVPQIKVDGIRALGADVCIAGPTQKDADDAVERLVHDRGLINISPFDDPYVIAGQGTIGVEVLEKRPDLKTLVIPLSGGGLAGGIALAAKTIKPDIRIIGVSMDQGAAMHASLTAGHPVDVDEYPSLADSLGGGIGLDNAYTLQLCRAYLDDVVLVSEDEIYQAMQALYYEERIIAEGSCVVGLAAMLNGKIAELEGPVGAIITGRNVDMAMFTRIINGDDVSLGEMVIKGRPYQP